jgi:four helix bundle protein
MQKPKIKIQIDIKRIYYSLVDQLLRSSTSVGANVVEARAFHSNKDFIKFYEISLKSANECKYWLCLLRDGLKLDAHTLNQLIDEANQISKIIASIVIKVKQHK